MHRYSGNGCAFVVDASGKAGVLTEWKILRKLAVAQSQERVCLTFQGELPCRAGLPVTGNPTGGSAGVAVVGTILLLWLGSAPPARGQGCPNIFPSIGNVGIATNTPWNALHIVGCPNTNLCDPTIRLSLKHPPELGCQEPIGTLTHHATISLISNAGAYSSLSQTGDLVIRVDTGNILYTVWDPGKRHVFTLGTGGGEDKAHVWIGHRFWGGWSDATEPCTSGVWTPLVGIGRPEPKGALHVGQFAVIESGGYWLNGAQTASCVGDTWQWYNYALTKAPVALLSGEFGRPDGRSVFLIVDKPSRDDPNNRVIWSREGYEFKGISIDAINGGVGIGMDRGSILQSAPYVHSEYSRLDVVAQCGECPPDTGRKAAIRVLAWGGNGRLQEQFKVSYDGYVMCRELKVALPESSEWESWPDYVFRSDYPLMPLEELEAYVRTHGHLPGVPSAAEVQQKGGIEVGKMTAKLLEKLEELTLYLLQMYTKQKELERENAVLRRQLEQVQYHVTLSTMSPNTGGQR